MHLCTNTLGYKNTLGYNETSLLRYVWRFANPAILALAKQHRKMWVSASCFSCLHLQATDVHMIAEDRVTCEGLDFDELEFLDPIRLVRM